MKYLFTTALIFFCSFLMNGQPPAPDFDVTDSQGQQHQLYADHLNQGKTVVLKLFFTYCPPCNTIAPLVEPLYQSWGGGAADVEFISLSTKSNDLSPAVQSYKAMHGHTFPGVGADGGSVAAAQPYMNNTYGLFFGTPTFVVIAPDGTVNFDPRGPNFQATIDSVDAAIAATGAQRPPVNYSGTGSIQTPDGEGILGVKVELAGFNDVEAYTDDNGNFDFSALLIPGQEYSLIASRDSSGHRNGVSTHDLILISRHILGVGIFQDPLQVLASDANRDGNVTTLDLILLRRLILGIDTELSSQKPWIFVNAEYLFIDPDDPFTEVYNGAATTVPFNTDAGWPLNLQGVKIGDVNDSADPSQ